MTCVIACGGCDEVHAHAYYGFWLKWVVLDVGGIHPSHYLGVDCAIAQKGRDVCMGDLLWAKNRNMGMFDKLKYIGLQKIVNHLNQLHKVSADGSKGEGLYIKICLEKILSVMASQRGKVDPFSILDGGCGTGIMSVELAQAGYAVTGVEIHKPSLEMAQERAKRKGVTIRWISGDLLSSLKDMPSQSFDAVICMGVLYTCPRYKEIMKEYSRVLKNDAIFIGTFRSKFYFITTLLRQQQYEKAIFVANNKEGILRVASVPSYYNWQSKDEVLTLFENSGLDLVDINPVGLFSGSGNDGMAGIADVDHIPSELDRSSLYELEKGGLHDCVGAGRFMLAVGKKSIAV